MIPLRVAAVVAGLPMVTSTVEMGVRIMEKVEKMLRCLRQCLLRLIPD